LTTEAIAAASQSSRVLRWDGCLNVRDLGGLPTENGQTVRWGALVRSDILCRLTEEGRRAPVAHGIRTIIDLRFADEAATDWDTYPFRDGQCETSFDGLRFLILPFHVSGADIWPELPERYDAAGTRGELNRIDLEVGRPGVGAVVAAIADAQPGGVLLHCHGGKDRTGVVVAVVLAFLGVPDQLIADDYALTGHNLEPLIVEWLDSMSSDPAERDRLRALAYPSQEAMLDTLENLRTRYESAEKYLRGGGVSDAQLVRLRERLLRPG
jgi:protein-tyrosine phosphatase